MNETSPISAAPSRWLDSAAIGVSLACLAHCLLVPTMLVVAPWLVPALWADESFHLWAVALAIPISIFGLGVGYRRHRRRGLLVIAAIGLALMAAGALLVSEALETPVTVAGASAVAFAHLRNWLEGRSSACSTVSPKLSPELPPQPEAAAVRHGE